MISDNFNNINALVVDNNGSMRQIMVSMLRAMGMEKVIVANNESQVLTLVVTEGINLVVCGWNMPKLNSLTVLEKLRKNDSTIKTPFVIVSTIIEQVKIKQAIKLGVSEYLVPPFNKKIFEKRISQALKLPIQPTAIEISRAINSKRFTNKEHTHELQVLIVDDIADNISIIKGVIQDEYKVKAVLNAKSAMKICLSDSPPDIVLLDIMMPEIDGFTLCRELKKNPLTQSIVVIFLTALTETKDVVKGLSLGAVDYITKPIIPEILKARIEVHSKIIINQRSIQEQIDNLLLQNDNFNIYNNELYKKISRLLQECSEGVSSASMSKKTSKLQLLDVKNNIAVTNILLQQFNTLIKLQQSHYQVIKTRLNIFNLLTNIMNSFAGLSSKKNIESVNILYDYAEVYCDEVLLIVVFSSLYFHAIESAPRGSKLSVTMDDFSDFTLIKVHHAIESVKDTISVYSNLYNQGRLLSEDINIHLAYLAITQLNYELYYSSSVENGTAFYIKLKKTN